MTIGILDTFEFVDEFMRSRLTVVQAIDVQPATRFMQADGQRTHVAFNCFNSSNSDATNLYLGGPPGTGALFAILGGTGSTAYFALLAFAFCSSPGIVRGEAWIETPTIGNHVIWLLEAWCVCTPTDDQLCQTMVRGR